MLINYKVNSNISRGEHQKALIAAVAASEEEAHAKGSLSRPRTTIELLETIHDQDDESTKMEDPAATSPKDDDPGTATAALELSDAGGGEEAGSDKPARKSSVRRKTELDHHGNRVSVEDVLIAEHVGTKMNESRGRTGSRASIISALDTMDDTEMRTRTKSLFDNEGESEHEIDMAEVMILNEMSGLKKSFVDHYKEAVDIVCERRDERARTLRPVSSVDIDRRSTTMPKFL